MMDTLLSTRNRRFFLIASLVLIVCGLLALAFAFWPMKPAEVIVTLPPTLFAPP
jgi:hypothetical protein